ncbi:MAG: glycoside hydrolase family 2 protein [Lachnospiraceae bacterium]|nr:glycoside hydrolase family 2 protein [Lachnospiraceae bacterium]
MIELNGAWEMRSENENEWHPARVPGSVYADLLSCGAIRDPFAGENEVAARELSGRDYYYRRTFEMPKFPRYDLVCEGIDTLAEIRINGKRVGRCDNMHRTWRFSVTKFLTSGENEIEIHFYSPLRYVRKMNGLRPIWGVDNAVPGYPYLRKAHSQFGWDWGPQLPDMGIWRSIYLEESKSARIDSVYIRQENRKDLSRIALEVKTEFQSIPSEYLEAGFGNAPEAELICVIRDPEGLEIYRKNKKAGGQSSFVAQIENPRLWWPAGYGEHPLYQAEVTLTVSGEEVSCQKIPFGIRDLRVVRRPDRWGESFSLCVNGCEIFTKGANVIPEDAILGRRSKERTERLLRDCVRSNYNCVRVWGGGHYPDDWFYDLCDELGLMVWQDFMFACAVYDLSSEFAKNIRAEVTDNVRRLRNHASLAAWCGNNEMESAWVGWGLPPDERLRGDYLTMFERLIPTVLQKEDPDRFYWPSSPSSGGGFADPSSEERGDAHYWEVWHGGRPFEDVERKFFRFFSEYGFEALPDLRTLLAVMDKEDLNLSGPVMELHQKCAGGNEKLLSYLMKYYLFPGDFGKLIYATQSLQGDFLEMAIRHLRSHRDRCAGSIYWQVNDVWPTVSWATIDYFGRWKGAQYIIRRAYAPVTVYAEPCADSDEFGVYVSFDTLPARYAYLVPEDCPYGQPGASVIVRARLMDQEKGVLCEKEGEIRVKPLGSVCAFRISPESDFSTMEESGAFGEERVVWTENFSNGPQGFGAVPYYSKRQRERYLHCEVVVQTAEEDGNLQETVLDSCNRLLCPPKAFDFKDPRFAAEILSEDGKLEHAKIRLTAREFARRVCVSVEGADVLFSDNFFDLLPGETKTVEVCEVRGRDAAAGRSAVTQTPEQSAAGEAPSEGTSAQPSENFRIRVMSNFDIA